MSGFNPLAALGAEAVAAAGQAIAEATLDLGLTAEVLRAQLSVGQVIPATILAPENGSDMLSILGQTVVAQLPQGVYPGDTLALQVTGFAGNQIAVLNLGVVDPQSALPPAVVAPASESEPAGQPQQATLQTVLPPPEPVSPPSAAAPATIPATAPPTIAPPREVFVAASVRPAPGASPPASPVAASSQALPGAPESEAGVPAAAVSEQSDLDARIATAWASSAGGGPRPPGTLASLPVPSARAGLPQAPPIVRSVPFAPRVQATIPVSAAASSLRASAPEQALLTRLGVPSTALTVAAARMISQAAQALPRAFARLDAALAGLPTDSQIPSLRALLTFAGNLDPANARALPEQLASFVNNVLDGAEAKLVSIFRALAPLQTTPPATQAQVAERTAAMDFDVKSMLLALAQSPPEGSSPALSQAIGSALTAVTALQLGALNAQSLDPNTIVVSLPVFYRQDGAPTQLRISRDGSNKKPLDADNFHVAFVLDTKSLGTVAIDLQAVGRSVSVNVKTEGASAADRFRASLGDLRSRLEQLRYRVAAIAADVAPLRTPLPIVPAVAKGTGELNPPSNLDLRA